MALEPLAYLPCNEANGYSAHDEISDYDGVYQAGVTVAQPGRYGTSVQIGTGALAGIVMPESFFAEFDPREFSISFWVKLTSLTICKPWEGWNAAMDYYAFEIRSGDNNLYLREGGVQDDIGLIGGTIALNTWAHYVIWNSESTGKCGIYFNGTYYETPRTLGGITPPLSAALSGLFGDTTGYAQHIAFWNRKLSQAEVDTICT